MQKLFDLFEEKVDVLSDSVDLLKETDDKCVYSMVKGAAFEEYSHLHIMYKYMKNNDIKISDTLEKRYKLAEEKLMQLWIESEKESRAKTLNTLLNVLSLLTL